jgi:hypothetical protein
MFSGKRISSLNLAPLEEDALNMKKAWMKLSEERVRYKM